MDILQQDEVPSHARSHISFEELLQMCKKLCVSKKGMRSDHSDKRLEFMKRSIKYKTIFIKKPVIDWKSIKDKDDVNRKFYVNLRNRLQEPFNYTEFNEAILHSGEDTAMINNSENQGWFHFIHNTLSPTLEARNSVLRAIQSDDNIPSPITLCHLKTLQHKVNKAVSIAKTRWSCHLVE